MLFCVYVNECADCWLNGRVWCGVVVVGWCVYGRRRMRFSPFRSSFDASRPFPSTEAQWREMPFSRRVNHVFSRAFTNLANRSKLWVGTRTLRTGFEPWNFWFSHHYIFPPSNVAQLAKTDFLGVFKSRSQPQIQFLYLFKNLCSFTSAV